jgi:hypothetical protein
VRRRWDTDERGHGVADARAFSDGARELVAAMEEPNWVAEEPEIHLLPHLRQACEAGNSPLALREVRVDGDGALVVDLSWQGGEEDSVQSAAWALLGTIGESASYVCQWRDDDSHVFDLVTGLVADDTPFAPHGHTLRLRVERES